MLILCFLIKSDRRFLQESAFKMGEKMKKDIHKRTTKKTPVILDMEDSAEDAEQSITNTQV